MAEILELRSTGTREEVVKSDCDDASAIRFIEFGQCGKLGPLALRQIRSHTTKQVYKEKSSGDQVYSAPYQIKPIPCHSPNLQPKRKRHQNRTGLNYFGGEFDAFSCLPQLPMELRSQSRLTESRNTCS